MASPTAAKPTIEPTAITARRLPCEVNAVSATSPVALRNVVVCLGLVDGSTTVEMCEGGKDPGRAETCKAGTDPGRSETGGGVAMVRSKATPERCECVSYCSLRMAVLPTAGMPCTGVPCEVACLRSAA